MIKLLYMMVWLCLATLLCLSCSEREKGADNLVTFVEGHVEIMKSGTESFKEIGPGHVFDSGDTIRTRNGSMADISFGNEGFLRLKEGTTLHIKEYAHRVKAIAAKLKLFSGIILCRIKRLNRKSSFEVATSVAGCG